MTIKLQSPAGCAGCSFAGQSYDADENGTVTVPHAAFEHLRTHGFTVATQGESDEAIKEPANASRKKKAE